MFYFILAAVFLALFAFLFCRLHLCASYEEDFFVYLRFLFLRFRLRLPSGGKNKEARKKRDADASKNRVRLFLSHFGNFFTFVRKTLQSLLRHLQVDRLELWLVVAGEDAAETALLYGEACSVVFPTAAFLQSLKHTHRQYVKVTPGFNAPESSVRFAFDVSIRLGTLLGIAVVRVCALLLAFVRKPGIVNHQKGSAAL